MSRFRSWVACVLVAACCQSAGAACPADFARQGTVLGACPGAVLRDPGAVPPPLACEGAFSIALDESLYRQVTDPALGDLAAFDAAGEALAFGPMPAAYRRPPGSWRESAWFALPPPSTTGGNDISLYVHRDSSGDLRLDAHLSHGPDPALHDVLVDVRAGKRLVEGIEFELALDAPDFSTALVVDASDDLQSWRNVASGLVIAPLRQDGRAFVRRRVEFPPVSAHYLRVHAQDVGAGVPLRSLRLLLRDGGVAAAELARSSMRAELVGRDGNGFVYRLPARIPVDRVDLRLGDDNAVASFAISVREPDQRGWQYVGQLDAFRLRGAGLELDSEPLAVAPTRAPEWRVEAGTTLSNAPVLELSYRPEEWLLLSHGKAPFRVVAGSRAARRDAFPLQMLVDAARRRYGADWRPASATLGPMADAGGDSALAAWDPARKRTLLLWGVLLLAAVAIIAMVLRLLRQPDR
ncbi:hypothetical protein BH11PSE14_BH11PSE14_13280 [soil metagenome]